MHATHKFTDWLRSARSASRMAVFLSFSAWQTYQPSSGGAPSACAHLKYTHTHTLAYCLHKKTHAQGINSIKCLPFKFHFWSPSLPLCDHTVTSPPVLPYHWFAYTRLIQNNLKLSFESSSFYLSCRLLVCGEIPVTMCPAAQNPPCPAEQMVEHRKRGRRTSAFGIKCTLKHRKIC